MTTEEQMRRRIRLLFRMTGVTLLLWGVTTIGVATTYSNTRSEEAQLKDLAKQNAGVLLQLRDCLEPQGTCAKASTERSALVSSAIIICGNDPTVKTKADALKCVKQILTP